MKSIIHKKISVGAKAAIVLTLATLFCKGINIITTPIFTRLLSTEEMGIVTTYNSWYAMICVVANLSLDSGSFNVAMMEFKNDRYGYMSSILSLSTLSTLILGGLFYIFKPVVSKLLGLSDSLMILMFISFIFLPATNYWMMRQRYEYKYKQTAIITFLSTGCSTIVAAVATILFNKLNYVNLAEVRLISGSGVLIACGVILYLHIMKRGKIIFSKKYWGFALTINFPLLIHTIAKQVLDVSDRTMIASMIGRREVGIYGVLYSVSALAQIVWSAINASLVPFMFEQLESNESDKISRVVEKMLLFYALTCVAITLIAPEILRVLATKEYYEGVYMMPPIAAGIFFISLYTIFSNVLLYRKKTFNIMLSTIVAAVINILLNYIFIKTYGYQMAAYTTFISYVILAIMQYISVLKTGDKKIFNHYRIWTISIITACLCMASNILYKYNSVRYLIIVLVLLILIIFHKKIINYVRTILGKK